MTENENEDNTKLEVEPVDDPDSYIQKRRLRDIFDARKDLREKRLEAKQAVGVDDQIASSHFRAAVENYLEELRPLVLKTELGRRIWYNQDFGDIVIQPPNDYHASEAKSIELNGLQSVFDVPDPIEVEFNVVRQVGLDSTRSETVSRQGQIPFDKLDHIVNQVNQHLAEQGIELDTDEGLPEDELLL